MSLDHGDSAPRVCKLIFNCSPISLKSSLLNYPPFLDKFGGGTKEDYPMFKHLINKNFSL